MKLTFLADEKQISLNPLSLRRSQQFSMSAEEKPANDKAEKADLERRLDEDIARVLGQEEPMEENLDHNADKKKSRAPMASYDEDNQEDPWWQNRVVGQPPSEEVSANLLQAMPGQEPALPDPSKEEDKQEKEDKDSEGTSTVSTPDTVEDRSQRDFDEKLKPDLVKYRLTFCEADLVKVAHLQIGALKALVVLMTCSRHIDLLLVPK